MADIPIDSSSSSPDAPMGVTHVQATPSSEGLSVAYPENRDRTRLQSNVVPQAIQFSPSAMERGEGGHGKFIHASEPTV